MTVLQNVLRDPDNFDWRHALYLPPRVKWSETTICAVLDPDESDDPDDLPPVAKQHGLRYALSISIVQDIVANARTQKANADLNDLLRAFVFYFDHDAFIEL